MSFTVWKPLYLDDFPQGAYLYHFTKIENALKILYFDSLRFSFLNRLNDTVESKLKLIYPQSKSMDTDKVKKVNEYLERNKQLIRLLSFSMDIQIRKEDKRKILSEYPDKYKYYDVSGRGFALPRMWAQYASNNEGVCFVINKKKFLDKIDEQVAIYKEGEVLYKRFFDGYYINSRQLDSLYTKISKVSNGNLTLIQLIMSDENFIKYNFFEKTDDWKNEHEYRIVAISTEDTPLEIKGIFSCIEGIVVGEKIDPAYEKVIRMLVDEMNKNNFECEVKKIIFGNQICKVK